MRHAAHLLGACAFALVACGCSPSFHHLPPSTSMFAAAEAAQGRAQIVDLSQPLHDGATIYSENVGWSFHHEAPLADPVPTFLTGEHTGTHMDAPVHFMLQGAEMSESRPADLVRPLSVIDIREAAGDDTSFAVDDDWIMAWEREHGRIPEGAMVFLLTGHPQSGVAATTNHPGLSESAAKFLREWRDVAGVGTDALSPDVGGDLSFPVHRVLLADECMILENLRNLEGLPANGAHVIMGPLRVHGGTGSPTRVLAILGARGEGRFRAVELTYELDKGTPYLPGRDHLYPAAARTGSTERPVRRGGTAGVVRLILNGGWFSMGERTGTHVVFPASSVPGGADAATFPPERLVGRAFRLDLSALPDGASATPEIVSEQLGDIDLRDAIIVIQTRRFWHVLEDRRSERYPGISPETAALLVDRGVAGIVSQAAGIDPIDVADAPAEKLVHQAGGFTGGFIRLPVTQNPPARGADLAILAMPIQGGTAAPARVIAFVPE